MGKLWTPPADFFWYCLLNTAIDGRNGYGTEPLPEQWVKMSSVDRQKAIAIYGRLGEAFAKLVGAPVCWECGEPAMEGDWAASEHKPVCRKHVR